MDPAGQVSRAIVRADGNDPNQFFANLRRIVSKTVPVFRYDPKLPKLKLLSAQIFPCRVD
jgi:hypothetical protein